MRTPTPRLSRPSARLVLWSLQAARLQAWTQPLRPVCLMLLHGMTISFGIGGGYGVFISPPKPFISTPRASSGSFSHPTSVPILF